MSDFERSMVYLLTGLAWGIIIGLGVGMYADRDRNKYAPAIIEYFDMRATSYDVVSDTTFIQPRHPRPDPEGK